MSQTPQEILNDKHIKCSDVMLFFKYLMSTDMRGKMTAKFRMSHPTTLSRQVGGGHTYFTLPGRVNHMTGLTLDQRWGHCLLVKLLTGNNGTA